MFLQKCTNVYFDFSFYIYINELFNKINIYKKRVYTLSIKILKISNLKQKHPTTRMLLF